MSKAIIQAESLCKDYLISHENAVAPYQTLRDSISGLFRKGGLKMRRSESEVFHALTNISFQVKEGEVLGVIGRNGAGKSTLLKVLSRITEPTSGRVRLNGRVASLLEVGTGFHPELTGRENIFLNGAILGMSRTEIRKKFDEIVDFFGAEKFLDTPVKRYSSGMYVRLAFAVAAHLEPEILIVDEVLAVGDAEFQKKCMGKMQDVAGSGRTILFVSHNMSAVRNLCNSCILLDKGTLVKHADSSSVISAYLNQGQRQSARFVKAGSKPRLTSVEVTPAGSKDLIISIGFESPEPIENPGFGVVICTLQGHPVTGFNTRMDPSFSAKDLKKGTVRLCYKDLPLHTGTYQASLWLNNGVDVLDTKENAVQFDFDGHYIIPDNLPTSFIGPLQSQGRWEFMDKS